MVRTLLKIVCESLIKQNSLNLGSSNHAPRYPFNLFENSRPHRKLHKSEWIQSEKTTYLMSSIVNYSGKRKTISMVKKIIIIIISVSYEFGRMGWHCRDEVQRIFFVGETFLYETIMVEGS